MQEHIRRAHPSHYIPKLPATEDSFILMINSNPADRPAPLSQSNQSTPSQALSNGPRSLPRPIDNSGIFSHERHPFSNSDRSRPVTPRAHDDFGGPVGGPTSRAMLPAASAAAALAQLHTINRSSKIESEWDSEGGVCCSLLFPNILTII